MIEKYLDSNGLKRVLQGISSFVSRSVDKVLDTKGKPSGIASLDSNGNVPLSQLGNVDTTLFEIVEQLPDSITERQKSHIFIVPRGKDAQTGQNKYKEYIYTGNAGAVISSLWEELGEFTSETDLKGYSKKGETISSINFDHELANSTLNLNISQADGNSKSIEVPIVRAPYEVDNGYGGSTQEPGTNGLMIATDKAKLDKIDVDALKASINNANTAATNSTKATEGAEKVNASLDGNVLTVTNRNGEKKSVDLTDSDEHVTINATTKVSDASMEGLIINVYLNNGADPQQYTTDSNGQAVFSVVKGSTYRVVFPYVKGCNPINPVQHVASVGNRIIDAEYVAEVIRYEHVTVWMNKENDDNVLMPWESANVYVTISGKKTTYTTDSSGKVTFDVEYGKSYNVSVEKLEGMYEQYDRYSNTRTAIADSYRFKFVYRKYQSGIWLVDDNNKHWTFDEWDASGNDNSHLMFVCIKTLSTQRYNGDIYISIDNLSQFAKFENKQWCPSNVQFKNIPLDGRNNSDTQYYKFVYNGLLATQTIIAEGDERNLQTPACDYCYSMTISNSDFNYQGYLPTIDQWNTAWQNIDMVVEAVNMKYPELHASRQNFSGNKWTSTQGGADGSCYFGTGVNSTIKSNWCLAFPFFACLSPSSPLRLSSESEQQDDEQRMAA